LLYAAHNVVRVGGGRLGAASIAKTPNPPPAARPKTGETARPPGPPAPPPPPHCLLPPPGAALLPPPIAVAVGFFYLGATCNFYLGGPLLSRPTRQTHWLPEPGGLGIPADRAERSPFGARRVLGGTRQRPRGVGGAQASCDLRLVGCAPGAPTFRLTGVLAPGPYRTRPRHTSEIWRRRANLHRSCNRNSPVVRTT
jgi:hypothetical protein